jgi:hypothetical protein
MKAGKGLATVKLPRRNFLHLAAGARCRAADRLTRRLGADLSDAAGASDRALRSGGCERHPRASDGSMAVGAPRPAICYRQPAGWRRQYRHRGGCACPGRRLHAAHCWRMERDQRDALRQAQFQFRAAGKHVEHTGSAPIAISRSPGSASSRSRYAAQRARFPDYGLLNLQRVRQ